MKQICLIVSIFFFAFSLYADKLECVKKTEETFKTDREACKDKKGEEKDKCISDAKEKKKSTVEECRKTAEACLEKAKAEKKTAVEQCKDKKGDEHKQCKESAQTKFKEAHEACKKG